MRKVRLFKFVETVDKNSGKTFMLKVEDGIALFHGLGVDFQKSQYGVGSFSCAVIERPDGIPHLWPLHLIQFITSFDVFSEKDIPEPCDPRDPNQPPH